MRIQTDKVRALARCETKKENLCIGKPYYVGKTNLKSNNFNWAIDIIYFDVKFGTVYEVHDRFSTVHFAGKEYNLRYTFTLNDEIQFSKGEKWARIPRTIIHPFLDEMLIIIKFTYDSYLPKMRIQKPIKDLDEIPF